MATTENHAGLHGGCYSYAELEQARAEGRRDALRAYVGDGAERSIRILARAERSGSQRGGDVVVESRSRRLRLGAYYGEPPGSHIGYWRTRMGAMRGWNLRVGKRYSGPCLTLFLHTEAER